MSNTFFQFKQFTIQQDRSAMKVTTDACLFGAWVASEINNYPGPGGTKIPNVLDIGTGTGLLSLMLAQKIRASIDAIELDKNAYEQAKDNITNSPWPERLHVIHADAGNYPYGKKYDLILSNPPFYEKEIISVDEKKNLAHHSEQLTLKDLLSIIKLNLDEGGKFFLLLPYKRNKEVTNFFKKQTVHIEKIVFLRQSVNHDFFRMMLTGGFLKKDPQETEIGEISILNDDQQYSPRFIELLKDYYLNL